MMPMPNPTPRHNLTALDFSDGHIWLGRHVGNGAFVHLVTLVCDPPAMAPPIAALINDNFCKELL